MTLQSFLQSQSEINSKYELTPEDQKQIKKSGIEEFIYKKLTSKKFRRWKLTPEAEKQIKGAVSIAVEKNEPVKVVFPQGGYKLWRLPTTPEVDWAEFFNISHLLSYVSTVAAGYKPGVELIYYMHTLLMEVHDNLTTEEINAYLDSFEKLLDHFRKYLPKNITVRIAKDADFYTREEYTQALEDNFEKGKEVFEAFDESRQQDFIDHGILNIKWSGKEDWTKLSEEEKEKQIVKSSIYEVVATSLLDRPAKHIKNEDKVLLFLKSSGPFMGVGSCKTSISKYWVGIGIVEKLDEKFRPRILAPSQFEKIKDKLKHEKSDLIDLKNFKEVGVYEGELDFLHR